MSKGDTTYDAEIERKLKTPPLEPPPEFKPQVPTTLLQTIAGYDQRDYRIILPMLEAWSISEQRQTWFIQNQIRHNQAIRELERENLDRSTTVMKVGLWFLTAALTGVSFALAAKYIHP